jgi:hypothetical protein
MFDFQAIPNLFVDSDEFGFECKSTHSKEKTPMATQSLSTPLEATPMESTMTASISDKQIWAGSVLSGLPALFLLVDGGMKLFKPPVVVEGTLQLGYPESAIFGIGVVLLISTFLYLFPRTAILGAILLTGYLGGAVATHVRVSAVLFNIIFPVFLGALLWGGLWLRDRPLRELLPLRDNRRFEDEFTKGAIIHANQYDPSAPRPARRAGTSL